MNFKENIFLIAFLPIVLLLYYILPKKARWGVLLASSLIFYILSSGIFTFIMLGTSVTIYVAGLLMQKINDNFKKQKSIEGITKEEKKLLKKKATNRKKLVVLAIVIINFGLLLTLKYGNFFLGTINIVFGMTIPPLSLILPLGFLSILYKQLAMLLMFIEELVKLIRILEEFCFLYVSFRK